MITVSEVDDADFCDVNNETTARMRFSLLFDLCQLKGVCEAYDLFFNYLSPVFTPIIETFHVEDTGGRQSIRSDPSQSLFLNTVPYLPRR